VHDLRLNVFRRTNHRPVYVDQHPGSLGCCNTVLMRLTLLPVTHSVIGVYDFPLKLIGVTINPC
jgi:hypothetical protein